MDRAGTKDFDGWIVIKKRVHEKRMRHNFKRGEIWWSSVGENVGSEIDGFLDLLK